jgi:hypothetical protein
MIGSILPDTFTRLSGKFRIYPVEKKLNQCFTTISASFI